MKVFEEFDFEDDEPMSREQARLQQVENMIDRALHGKHNEWEFIRSLAELEAAKIAVTATNKIIKGFTKSAKALLKAYRKEVKEKKGSTDTVVAIQELAKTIQFYSDEVRTVKDMIAEFKVYMSRGHFVEMLLGQHRTAEDLYDFRKPKPTNL